MDKFEEKENQFAQIADKLLKQFALKNKHYGNNFFEGDYTEQEDWMSIRRKVARLQAYYSGITKDSMPNESVDDSWSDLCIYAIMVLIKRGNKNGTSINK